MKKLRGFMAGVIALVFLLAVPATYAREKSLMVTAGGIGAAGSSPGRPSTKDGKSPFRT